MQTFFRTLTCGARSIHSAGFRLGLAVVALMTGAGAAGQEPRAAEHPLVPALRLAKASLEAAEQVRAFEAVFYKRDEVNGYLYAHSAYVKFRAEPLSVYMKFHQPHEGREVIYVAGRNGGNLLAHESGLKSLIGTVALHPKSEQALSESRYPITEMGLAKLAKGVITLWESELKYGEIDVKYYPNATHPQLGKRECQVIESTHPVPRRQFKFHKTRLWIDKETGLPVRVEQYGFPRREGERPPLLEEYTYRDVKTDVELNDIDFDVRNPQYSF